jgi:uncharacterized protein YciI
MTRSPLRAAPWTLAVAAVASLGAAFAVGRASAAPEMKAQVFQTVVYTMTDKWDKAKPSEQQPGFAEHIARAKEAFEKGTILLGGPYGDMSGAVVVLNLTPADAKKFAEEDPLVKAGVVTAVVKPWAVVFSHAKWDVTLLPPAPTPADPHADNSCGAGGKACGK